MNDKLTLAIVVPCLNEEEALPRTHCALSVLLASLREEGEISGDSFILYVDDGSTDGTWEFIRRSSSRETRGIRLSRNFGHQYALLAGMEYAAGRCGACVTIDADLQDDPSVIRSMLEAYRDGAEVVYGVRSRRDTDSSFKRGSAHGFYRMMHLLGVDCVYDHADYRLLGSEALSSLLEYRERNVFLRGIIPQLGYRQEKVYYHRKSRKRGRSKYPLGKMAEFAADGVTSFSVRPVRMLFWLGVLFMATAFAFGVYVLIRHVGGHTIEGWTSLILSIWFCTGILLFGMGILGEYVGKIYTEVKKRPRYRVAETVCGGNTGSDKLEDVELVADLPAGEEAAF